MSIKSKLEEAARCLQAARDEAEERGNSSVVSDITCVMGLLDEFAKRADPGKEWRREACALWDAKGIKITVIEFAALVSAGELRKYAEHYGFTVEGDQVIFQQIADLEAIAKGGGE